MNQKQKGSGKEWDNRPAGVVIKELRQEVKDLKERAEKSKFEFRSELEDVIRAQHALETILTLTREINPTIFRTIEEGRTLIKNLDLCASVVKTAINAEWMSLGAGKKTSRPDVDFAQWLDETVRRLNKEEEEKENNKDESEEIEV